MSSPRLMPLPIDPHVPAIVDSMKRDGCLLLQAEPGAGKTTRVPPALIPLGAGEVWVLQPRRIAARLAALRVAEELGERPGETVGYQVRHEVVGGPKTRLRFVTEGILTRRLMDDPSLEGISVLVLDEFHERHIHGDLALATALSLRRRKRPDLRLLVMSATLDLSSLSSHLPGARVIEVAGRSYPVRVEHSAPGDTSPLPKRALLAIRRVISEKKNEENQGDILVFLPGAAEIRATRGLLEDLAANADIDIVPLHGALPFAEQDLAVRPSVRRRVVLSTNVAETSITLPSVTCVIDSGLARVARHSPWSGLQSLALAPISRASAKQRAGRAGRTGPGRCIRLYTEHDLLGRPRSAPPEIERADLTELCLCLAAGGILDPASLPWLDPPPPASLTAAGELLRRLDAIDDGGAITDTGRQMARLSAHPRQARLLVEAARRKVLTPASTLAAIAGERDILAKRPDLELSSARSVGPCDLLERRERLIGAGSHRRNDATIERGAGLDPAAVRAVLQASRQLRHSREADSMSLSKEEEDALRISILSAWPDRVARRRRRGDPAFVLAEGGEVRLSRASVVQDSEWLVAVDATRHGGSVIVHLATTIEPEWLLDLFPNRVEERLDIHWNPAAMRVEAHSRLAFGDAVLAESRESARDRPEAWKMLAEQARRSGLAAFADPEAIDTLLGRLRVAAAADPKGSYPNLDELSLDEAIERACQGRTRLEELSTSAIVDAFLAFVPWEARSRLDSLAPLHVSLPGRARAPVRYPVGREPYVASRIQDFFGQDAAPRIGGGKVPLVVHLLAPNNRPVQITQDLGGFWTRHYPEIRRQLSRRYPRHAWPEDPMAKA